MRPHRLAALALLLLPACGDPATAPLTASAPASKSPVACATPPAVIQQPPTAADWPVYDRAGDRHGADPNGGAARTPSPLWGVRLDGSMFAQPLVVQGLVIEATEHDSVYAFDAATGCQAWRTSLGTSLDVNRHHLQCNNI